jgi:cysteine desulfurase
VTIASVTAANIYLDYAATTPLDAEVEAAMRPWQFAQGNAASVHGPGRAARHALDEAREQLATVLGGDSRELIFTSGGTEADNQAILGAAWRPLPAGASANAKPHVITSSIEHSAVLASARFLAAQGLAEVTFLAPDHFGQISAEQVRQALQNNTVLVSIMHINNEVGTVQDISAIANVCLLAGVPLHVDAVQSLGCVPLDVHALGASMASLSAHKFYGPKGVGALWLRRGLEWPSLLHGGQQEGGRRGGTHNLPAIVGMSLAAAKAAAQQPAEAARLSGLRDWFLAALLQFAGVAANGHPTKRSPRHVNVTAQGADGEALLMNLDLAGVAASSGSACSAGTLEPSHVLLALGRSRAEARASVRFSLGRSSNMQVLEAAVAAFGVALERARG